MASNLSLPFSAPPPVQRFGRRSLLPLKTNVLWKIETGAVRTVTWLEDGTTITLGLWGPGDVVGRPLTKIEPYQMECLTVVEATFIPMETWHPNMELFLAHIRQAEQLIWIRSHKRVEEMLIKLFNWLAQRFGSQVEQGRLINIHLTHQDLAELLGTTRVTVTRTLKQLEENGLIQRLPRHLTVLQAEEFWHYEI